ncbi:family 20 glycosylhydrolase [Belliella kenyensis]|uniref:Family 20 glycosylhydrolase n=1 Tax=Belliella kenyensis TaxID=1472724 RepID=A0ABV8ERR5_9BACT|nr:family 20 glycosylhydrolase [Belliella kenyensis]MCH7402002.1 family 20 glycosylhydrolase [Belliella kenyensis]MDN3605166.1 family 20 glycosylhydrolase [Belliella kenyensis]
MPQYIRYFLTLVLLSICYASSLASDLVEAKEDDFKIKGFHLDLRIQVMTPDALKSFAEEMKSFGLNTLVVEWEGTFPFEKHATISNKYSYSKLEIEDFINHCEKLDIKVIPLQQSLGHVEYILRNPRYSHLKEDRKDISQICPLKTEESKELFTDLFQELVETHNSEFIHIGGDETYLLGHCELCSQKAREVGKSKLFVDHMKMVTNIVIEMGKIPLMWADIILKYPEAAAELPKETIFVDWNYGWKINHFGDIPKLQKLGFSFWGSPSIRSHPDNWYVTDWSTHFKNQRDFIPHARANNYKGIVMTSWSTTGLYGFTWDVGYDVVDMVQIRNTYPMSGFRILISSYAESLKNDKPIDPKIYVLKYANERFGLNDDDALKLWSFLHFPPELIVNGKPERSKDIEEMRINFGKVRNELALVAPRYNEKEFDHFKLMADLRMHYLEYKEIEAFYNSEAYSPDMNHTLSSKLETLLEDSKKLSERFTSLNKGFLYDAELDEQNILRAQQIQVLYSRISKKK